MKSFSFFRSATPREMPHGEMLQHRLCLRQSLSGHVAEGDLICGYARSLDTSQCKGTFGVCFLLGKEVQGVLTDAQSSELLLRRLQRSFDASRPVTAYCLVLLGHSH